MVGSDKPLLDYAGVSRGTVGALAPLVAVPTTAGTGSEVSVGFIVIVDDGRKLTFVAGEFLPRAAICDPELTIGLPPRLTAATGMDAVSHCIEAVPSPVINPPAEAIGLDGLEQAIGDGNLTRTVADGNDRTARWQKMMAATEGAIAFEPRGRAAWWLIAPSRHSQCRGSFRMCCVSIAASRRRSSNVSVGRWVSAATRSTLGITEAHIPDLVDHAAADIAGSTNPCPVGADDYRKLFAAAIG